jgi:ubiquinone/menaquinone biosynthesis C-methylase UbiE
MKEKKVKINIGSGDTRYEDYVTIDFDPNSNADIILDLEKEKLPFEDSTVEAVIAHHILEHLGEGYFHCLQELYRVCKHGAVIDVRVPHPRHDSFLADPTHRRPITVIGLQMFSQKFNRLCRETQSATSRLGEYFNIDFEILNFHYIPDSQAKFNFSGFSAEQIEEYANQHNNIISEIHIKMIVIKNAK